MSGFTCCFWWFLLGFLLGWLLNWLLKRCCGNKNVQHTHTAPPVNKVAAAPVAPVAPKPVEPKVIPFDLAAAKAAGFAIKMCIRDRFAIDTKCQRRLNTGTTKSNTSI